MKLSAKDILLCAFVLMILAIFNFICFDGARNVTASYQAKDTCVTLQATITSSDHYTEIDEGFERDYWHANVTYTYNGITYSGVYYDHTYREPEIGKVVTVSIDPENPGELLPDRAEMTLSLILSPVFLTGVTIGLYYWVCSVIEILNAAKDHRDEQREKGIALLFVGIKLVIESVVFYNKHDSLVFAIFSLIAAVAFWFFILRKSGKDTHEPKHQPAQECV